MCHCQAPERLHPNLYSSHHQVCKIVSGDDIVWKRNLGALFLEHIIIIVIIFFVIFRITNSCRLLPLLMLLDNCLSQNISNWEVVPRRRIRVGKCCEI